MEELLDASGGFNHLNDALVAQPASFVEQRARTYIETSLERSNLISVVLITPTSRNVLRPRIDSKASGTGEDIKAPGDLQGRFATKVIPETQVENASARVLGGPVVLPSRNTSESGSENAPR